MLDVFRLSSHIGDAVITLEVDKKNNPANHPPPTIELRGDTWAGHFSAMASPCEVLIEGAPQPIAKALVEIAAIEAWRIEHKFSRYVDDNIVYQINHCDGHSVQIDDETARLLSYANHCYEITDGMFDITSGVLRRAWRFDGSDNTPSQMSINNALAKVGWHKVQHSLDSILLQPGMEIDFGGIGKEYAVDHTLGLLTDYVDANHNRDTAILVNFGGDIACAGKREDQSPWHIGIERCIGVESPINVNAATNAINLQHGAVATSGDSRRFLIKEGKRLSHILNPKTGWPVENAPHSVTVIAQTCTLAGMFATFAMLEGKNAESFLEAQSGIRFWVQR